MTLILLWAEKGLNYYLMAGVIWFPPLPCEGPKIQIVPDKLEVQTSTESIAYFMLWFACDTYKFILKINFVVCFVVRIERITQFEILNCE